MAKCMKGFIMETKTCSTPCYGCCDYEPRNKKQVKEANDKAEFAIYRSPACVQCHLYSEPHDMCRLIQRENWWPEKARHPECLIRLKEYED